MSLRDDALAAFDHSDSRVLEGLGWTAIGRALAEWWPGRFDPDADLRPYVELLGEREPTSIIATLEDLGGTAKFRPKPGEILRRLLELEPEPSRPAAHGKSSAKREATLEAVRACLERGEATCECLPRPVTVIEARDGVVRCPRCGGIETGQAYETEDRFWPMPAAGEVDLPAMARAMLDSGEVADNPFLRAIADRGRGGGGAES